MAVGEKQRLLVVDDDHEIGLMLKDHLQSEGYEVEVFLDAPEVLRHVELHGLPHLALIDLRMPDMNGFELSKELKSRGDVPIVFVTADDRPKSMIDGLTQYADDYVTKPFDLAVLTARIRRVLSRMSDYNYARLPIIHVDSRVSVDFGAGRLLIGERSIMLTPTEASLLHILMRNAGRVVPSNVIIARTWPNNRRVFEDTLRVHMHRLRRKLASGNQQPNYIRTERGIGYSFIPIDAVSSERVDAISIHWGIEQG